jgi:hypothetical protein
MSRADESLATKTARNVPVEKPVANKNDGATIRGKME